MKNLLCWKWRDEILFFWHRGASSTCQEQKRREESIRLDYKDKNWIFSSDFSDTVSILDQPNNKKDRDVGT